MALIGNNYKLGKKESIETRRRKRLAKTGTKREYRLDGSWYMRKQENV